MKAVDVNSSESEVNPIAQLADTFISGIQNKELFYRYGDALVTPDTDTESGTGRLKVLTAPHLKWHLRRAIPNEPEKVITPVADDILHNPELPLQRIHGLVTAPAFRGDLSLITVPGFDEKSGLYYAPDSSLANFTFSTGADRVQAKASLALLFELLRDFPFKQEKDRFAYIAALLTLFLRSSIRAVVPAFALNGNGQSVGKGLLSSMLSWIPYGKDAASMSVPKGREEWGSKLDSILLKGEPFQVVDNIVGSFASDDFASLLTSTMRTVRIKGFSKIVEVPANTVWILNGNDMSVDSDMAQRLLMCHLEHEDASGRKQENFHIQKTYGCSIETLLRNDRAKYMQACLDLICAWVNDGAPKRRKLVMAKYGVWESVVGGVFDWLEIEPVFLSDHLKDIAFVDTEKDETITFLRKLMDAFPRCDKNPISASDITAKVFPEGEKSALRDFVPEALMRTQGSFTKKLGRWLKNAATRKWGNIELAPQYDDHAGVWTYRIGIGIKSQKTRGFDAEFEDDEPAAA